MKPIVTTAYLVDVAAHLKVDMIPKKYVVTMDDVRGAMRRQGLRLDDFKAGDAVCFHYGYEDLWLSDPDEYLDNTGGISCEVAEYFASRGAVLFCGDSHPIEAKPSAVEPLFDPVHTYILPKYGMHMLENLTFKELIKDDVYKFMLVVNPIKYVGGIASPVAPLAIA